MITLLNEYKIARKELNDMIEKLDDTFENIEDKKLLNSMVSSVTYIIDWLETGGDPLEMRGININSVYHLKYLPNMAILPDITEQFEREPLTLSGKQKHMIACIFDMWSARERDCFIMHIAEQKSMAQIAQEMNISKSAVQTNIDRAKNKIEIVKRNTNQMVLV